MVFFVAAYLRQAGITTASVTNAGFLSALYVVFTTVAAWLLTKSRRAVFPAVAPSFGGTWLLTGGMIGGFHVGDGLLAARAVFWAVHVVVTSQASQNKRPIAFTCLQFVVVGSIALTAAALFERHTLSGPWAALGAIAYVGIMSSALMFTILEVGMRHTPPAEAAILVSTEALFAAAAGALLLGERLGIVSWLGAAVIMAGVAMVQVAPVIGRPSSRAAE